MLNKKVKFKIKKILTNKKKKQNILPKLKL